DRGAIAEPIDDEPPAPPGSERRATRLGAGPASQRDGAVPADEGCVTPVSVTPLSVTPLVSAVAGQAPVVAPLAAFRDGGSERLSDQALPDTSSAGGQAPSEPLPSAALPDGAPALGPPREVVPPEAPAHSATPPAEPPHAAIPRRRPPRRRRRPGRSSS